MKSSLARGTEVSFAPSTRMARAPHYVCFPVATLLACKACIAGGCCQKTMEREERLLVRLNPDVLTDVISNLSEIQNKWVIETVEDSSITEYDVHKIIVLPNSPNSIELSDDRNVKDMWISQFLVRRHDSLLTPLACLCHSVREWNTCTTFNVSLDTLDLVFFPMLSTTHHYVVCYNLKMPSLDILDNKSSEGSYEQLEQLDKLRFEIVRRMIFTRINERRDAISSILDQEGNDAPN
ncbi:hypothetical protein POM88_044023 [Heracleum sosnowskyi]|uniref:Uncharacterized protein n=1 Tax=Heracleum sosnowskyi TaxID=360622 RepID=A0AAD8H4H4_9APIA|nr:hypothetical protein POM88_044023 [Heracleum sosnowskyi]